MRAVVGAVAVLVLAAGSGLVVGVLAVLVHRAGTGILPWGLALAVLASLAGSLGLRACGTATPGLLAYGVAWVVAVGWLLSGRPEGDYLVAADAVGWGFLVLGAGAVVVATAWATRVAPRRPEHPPP